VELQWGEPDSARRILLFGGVRENKVSWPNYDEGKPNALWPSHFMARERVYLHAENLANLDQLPVTGFEISFFPIKIERASGAWIRAIAHLPE